MSVYVDDAFIPFGRMLMSHMTADTLDELHAMADALGLRRAWFQSDEDHSVAHYDVSKGVRERAIKLGAIPEDWRNAANVIKRDRERQCRERQLQGRDHDAGGATSGSRKATKSSSSTASGATRSTRMSKWDALFCIDPGGTTGIACGVYPRRGSIKGRVRRGKRTWYGQLETAYAVERVPNTYSDEMAVAFQLVHAINSFAEQVKPLVPEVVVEDFILRNQRYGGAQKREGISPVRIASSLEAFLYLNAESGMEWRHQPVYQTAAKAKGFATDARLREWGLWHRGQEHARDASRHLATRLADLGNMGSK